MVWKTHIGHDGYEINTRFPYAIRNKQTHEPAGCYNSDDMVWETLKGYSNYEINTAYPHYIRHKRKLNIIAIYVERNGYYRLNLQPDDTTQHKLKPYQHDLISKQWIDNDDVELKTQIDHINRNRLDNHIYNLRWTTPSENNSNKRGFAGDVYKFEHALVCKSIVKVYHNHEFVNLYKMDDDYYVFTVDRIYERLIKRVDKNNRPCLYVYDANNYPVRIYLDD